MYAHNVRVIGNASRLCNSSRNSRKEVEIHIHGQ